MAAAVRRIAPRMEVNSVLRWRRGALAGQSDEALLSAAADQWTLATYDVTTVPPLLAQWAAEGRAHAGVILISRQTIDGADFGMLARALVRLAAASDAVDWTNRVVYLRRA